MIPQEIKDKIEAYVEHRDRHVAVIGDVVHGYSLALPEIEQLKQRVRELEEALKEIAEGFTDEWAQGVATAALNPKG